MKTQISEQLFQLRERFVTSVNSGFASAELTERAAGSLLREIRNGGFQRWPITANSLGRMSIFTNTVELIGEFDAISIHEIRFGSLVEGETLMIGNHLYPDEDWKIYAANIVLPLGSTRAGGVE